MNKYSNKKIIGIGLTSVVYKALDINKNQVAIKKIKNDNISDKFKSEIEIIKSLNNKNILKFIEIIKHKESIYIISELCDYPLSKIIDKLDDEHEIMKIMYQLSQGLKYLYENNILHRDLKPDNILILNNEIKIADFGFAKIFDNNNSMLNTFCGTPNYMAPEILLNSLYNSKSDLWSLGMILYQIIYKKFPFKNIDNIIELTKHYKNSAIEFPKTKYSDNLMNLLKSLLIIDFSKRISWEELFDYPFLTNYSKYKKNDTVTNISTEKNKTTNESISESINNNLLTHMNSRLIENYILKDVIIKEPKIINITESVIENYFSIEKQQTSDTKVFKENTHPIKKIENKKSFFFLINFIREFLKI
jgi:serine/threonine protein kinase